MMRWQQLPDWLADKISPEPNTGCWLWMASLTSTGYGAVALRKTRVIRKAHRVVFEWLCGPIPKDRQLDHRCRQRSCVNPAHLDIVTGRENTLRGVGRTAVNVRKTHCPRGHALTGTNVIWRKTMRTCRICKYAATEASRRAERCQ